MADDIAALRDVFQMELADATLEIVPETKLSDIPGWDSVNMSCVILGVESRFGFTMTPDEMDRLTTFGDFIQIVRQKT
jgi:acyl carrier protein